MYDWINTIVIIELALQHEATAQDAVAPIRFHLAQAAELKLNFLCTWYSRMFDRDVDIPEIVVLAIKELYQDEIGNVPDEGDAMRCLVLEVDKSPVMERAIDVLHQRVIADASVQSLVTRAEHPLGVNDHGR